MTTITITTDAILQEVRQKSHLSVQDISDPEARDNARAGLDKLDEIKRCVQGAFGRVRRICGRFLINDNVDTAGNNTPLPSSYIFEFEFAARRAINKAEALEEAIRGFVVQHALARFCATVNQTERSNQHSIAALDWENQIQQLLFTKRPPI